MIRFTDIGSNNTPNTDSMSEVRNLLIYQPKLCKVCDWCESFGFVNPLINYRSDGCTCIHVCISCIKTNLIRYEIKPNITNILIKAVKGKVIVSKLTNKDVDGVMEAVKHLLSFDFKYEYVDRAPYYGSADLFLWRLFLEPGV